MASHSQSKVCFFFDRVKFSLSNRTGLKKFIEQVFHNEGRKLENLNFIFCTDRRLLKINKDYLDHDYYTDIITFELSEPRSAVIGEVYISIDRVRQNAQLLQQSYKSEIHRVIFHGVLHLCGYSDKNNTQKLKMRKAEEKLLAAYFK